MGGVSPQSESGEGRALAGTGTEGDPYQISSAEELREFAELVNGGETTANAVLTADIDLSSVCGPELNDGTSWEPIGNSINQYIGNFNGDGHTISGLYINNSTADYQGLFGCLDQGGTVQDLTVSGSVSGNNYVGGVVGLNRGSVEDCGFTGSVSGNNYVGGVVGENSGSNGTVENCHNTGKVSGPDSVGGVVGHNNSTVENCYNTGAVNSSGNYVGGVVGYNSNSNVENCYNIGEVSGNSYVGGVVGRNSSATVTNCYNTGKVSGNQVGGAVGLNRGIVTGCYFLQQDGLSGGATGAAAVKDLNALCENFKSVTGWEINTTLNRPVLTSNHEDDGTQAHPYRISTATQLKNFATAVNGGEKSANAKLMNNIDLSSVCGESNSWTPIGTSEETAYTGTFNGNGKTISGLYIAGDDDDQGLFGYLDQGGTVQNLTVSGTITSSGDYVGGVVGYNSSGTVTNCTNEVAITVTNGGSNIFVGGVVGWNSNSARVENSYNTGSVNGSKLYVGGIVGNNNGSVENCYNTGTVSDGTTSGGIVGNNNGSVANCYYQIDKGAIVGIGGTTADDTRTVAKTAAEFQSGEVAYLLQNGQKAAEGGVVPLVWGQSKLGETTSLPTLNPTDEQKVYQVTFDYGDSFTETDDRYDYRYANANDNVTLPTSTDPIPSYEGHTLTGWQDENETQVSGNTVTITSDTTYYAQWTKDTVNYTVTVTTSPAEGGTVNGGGTFAEGTQVTVTATANDGYTL